MKTVVLLGVLVLLLLFLNWRNPTEHMTLVKGIPVVEQADVNALLALWRPDPIIVKKQEEVKQLSAKVQRCGEANLQNAVRGRWWDRYNSIVNDLRNAGTTTEMDDATKLEKLNPFISKYNC